MPQAHTLKIERIFSSVEREISIALRKGFAVVIGPWIGESGYELLYWAPLVRRIVETFAVPLDRLLVISRGGTASWYGYVAKQYADVFSLVSLTEWNAVFSARPQGDWSARKREDRARKETFTREILRRAASAHGIGRIARLDSKILDPIFRPFWAGLEPVSYLERYASYARIQPPQPIPGLPQDYVAVRFYSNMFFPDTPANRGFANETVAAIERFLPVVLLDQPVAWGEHCDLCDNAPHALRVFGDSVDLANNYALQTAVIGHARAFVGTYGSVSYLPIFCGVPSFAVHSGDRKRLLAKHRLTRKHYAVVQHLCRRLSGTFTICDAARSKPRVAEQVRLCTIGA